MATAADGGMKVGFVGAGMMASALMDGLIGTGVANPSSLTCSDPWDQARERAAAKGIHATTSNREVVERSDVVIIATKPNIVEAACAAFSEVERSTTLFISIAAGVPLDKLQAYIPGARVIRVMPNTPCLVGAAAAGFALGAHATAADKATCLAIFGSVGTAVEVHEYLLNAVTGLSGSGPAYVYQFIEALSDGGVRAGLPRGVATQLAAQTVKGAAEMVLSTGTHPGELKDQVTSPGGTTIAGVEALEKGGFRAATIAAVCAATRRSMQLGGVPADEIRDKYNL